MSKICKRFVPVALAVVTWATSPGALADEPAPRLRSGAWWQWVLSIPAPSNPLVDANGGNCMVGQSGRTWFLAGTFFGGTASRSCSVPEGVELIFPVANSIQIDTPGVCGQTGSLSVAELRTNAAQVIDGLKQFTATLNSRPVRPIRRIRSDVFPVALPTENIFNLPSVCGPGGVPAAVYSRAVDDGYYVEIDDLGVGEHMLQFTATFADNSRVDVSYRLIVVPRDRR